MRVLVCCDRVGALSSSEAGRALADGWSGQATAVVPCGEAGAGLLRAVADAAGAELVDLVQDDRLASQVDAGPLRAVAVAGPGVGAGPVPYGASSASLGAALAELLADTPGGASIFVDLVAEDVHDGGAGLLAGLGAVADVPLDQGVAALTGLTHLDLATVRSRVGDRDLVGVLPSNQRDRLLLGLRGITSLRGRAYEADPARLLATDAALGKLAELAGIADRPGLGACGGTALGILAAGGRLATGPDLLIGEVPGPVDLVVTGCSVFEAVGRGGGVVAAAAALAGRLLCPCLVIAGEVLVGGREMRTMGIEAAYAVRSSTADTPTGGDVGADELTAVAARVARSWRW